LSVLIGLTRCEIKLTVIVLYWSPGY